MIAELKPYPTMKHSGVEWLGEVPEHWEQVPGRSCFSEKKVPNAGMVETAVLSLSYGRIVIKPEEKLTGLVPESFETYQVVDPGDIICRPTDLQNDHTSLRFGISNNRGIITSAYMCLETQEQLARRFGYSLLHTYDLKKVFYGLGSGLRQNLSWNDFKYLPCVIPPLPEQEAIVRFIDYVDRRIRRYIRAKRKLIKLLEEQKQAIIHQAVTGQIDVRTGKPYPAYKPSGIEWLGQVPGHWDVRSLTRSVVERADYRGATPEKVESGVVLVTAKNIRKGWIDYDVSREYVAEDRYSEIMRRGLPKLGDLLLTMEAPLGHAALVDDERVAFAQRVVRFRMTPELFWPRFVLLAALSQYIQDQLLSRGTGSTALGIKSSKLPQVRLLQPPMEEQSAVLLHIDNTTGPLDITISSTNREIELLNEYRTRLIADVVTGKLDVREADASLPDDTDETELDVDDEGPGDVETSEEEAPEINEEEE